MPEMDTLQAHRPLSKAAEVVGNFFLAPR